MIVDNAVYRNGVRVRLDCAVQDLAAVRDELTGDGDFVWVGLHEPSAAELDQVAGAFGLHPLAVEDALHAHQRPKLERFDDSLFLVLKTLWYVDEDDAVETGEINIFMGPQFIVTVRHGEGASLRAARQYLESREQILSHGPTAVIYAVCDRVVDSYLEVARELEVDVDEIEASVFSPARTNDSNRIYTLKREIAEVRRAVMPLRDPMRRAAAAAVAGMSPEAAPYFRDVTDHLDQVAESIENLDALLSTAFDAHAARISMQQNDDMRKISAGAAIVVVPTLIAGVYGMNFDHMPELHWQFGYGYAIALMVGSALTLFWFFKKSGWL